MELNHMIHQMCFEVLTGPDLKAICKARGFSHSESASRSTFENAFLSSAGLANALAELNETEVMTLHLLREQPDPVDISFFARLYNPDEDRYHRLTFSQTYKSTLDTVRKQLVRKGILVMAIETTNQQPTQMERWRFALPPLVARSLPPLIANPHHAVAPGKQQRQFLTRKLREATGGAPAFSETARGAFQITLENGSLRIGGGLFHLNLLEHWQRLTWEKDVMGNRGSISNTFSPVTAIIKILQSLGPDQWAAPAQLMKPYQIYAYETGSLPSPEEVCKSGWKWGLLTRLSEAGQTYYRLPSAVVEDEPTHFDVYLRPGPEKDTLLLDLETAPLKVIEQLNQLVHLSAHHENLLLRPALIKMGRANPDLRGSPLAIWLRENWSMFAQRMEQIEQRWGKIILHRDLVVARVRDLSLRVQIERELKDQVVVLDEEFIAFPYSMRTGVERLVKKGGFVVKEVKA